MKKQTIIVTGASSGIGKEIARHFLELGDNVVINSPIASKGSIHALTLQLAAEFGKHNIRVNTIAPGVIRTPMHGEDADQSAGLHLVNHIGEVEDVAQMVYTVAKSNFISGAIINVDGGMGAGHHLN